MKLKDVFAWKTVAGKRVTMHDIIITPQSQTLIVRWPGGAFVWQRPTALLVEQRGQVKRYRIIDITRILQLGLLGATLVIGIVSSRMLRQRKEHHS